MSVDNYMKLKATKDTAVYWSTPTPGLDGHLNYAAPVEIGCLWQEKTKMIRDANGRDVISNASVWVTQDLDDSGMLFHGSLTDLTAGEQSDPRKRKDAYEIKSFVKIPSMYIAGEHSRRAML